MAVAGDRRARIAQAALAHVDCSSIKNATLYQDVVRRPADASPMLDAFYLHNRSMSSCALFALGVLRLSGCVEAECVAPYFPRGGPERDAVIDVQVLARRFDAWVTSSPPVPMFRMGDIWIVCDEHGNDPHVGVCVEDAVSMPDGVRTVKTVEGGQSSGSDSSAIGAFTRTWRFAGNRWALGTRLLLGFAYAGHMPVSDSTDGDVEVGQHVDPEGQNT